ncbi:MAG: plasmid stabilization protein [bacterium]
MYRLVWTNQFQRRARKFFRQHNDLLERFKERLRKIEENPFDETLETHILKGSLKEKLSISLNYEYRIIIAIDRTENRVILHDIGSHDEVY